MHFPVPLLPTLIRSRLQVKPGTFLIPIDVFLIFGGGFTVPGAKVAPFPLLTNVGALFTACENFSVRGIRPTAVMVENFKSEVGERL
jgi:hypothetical protein